MQSKLEPDRVEYHGIYTPHKMRDWLLANMSVAHVLILYISVFPNFDFTMVQMIITTSRIIIIIIMIIIIIIVFVLFPRVLVGFT